MNGKLHQGQQIPAPEGYEAITYWRDRSGMQGSWEVAYRRENATYWIIAGSIGHASSENEWVIEAAAAWVAYCICMDNADVLKMHMEYVLRRPVNVRS